MDLSNTMIPARAFGHTSISVVAIKVGKIRFSGNSTCRLCCACGKRQNLGLKRFRVGGDDQPRKSTDKLGQPERYWAVESFKIRTESGGEIRSIPYREAAWWHALYCRCRSIVLWVLSLSPLRACCGSWHVRIGRPNLQVFVN